MLEDSQRWISFLLVLSTLINTDAFSTKSHGRRLPTPIATATCSSFFGVISPSSSWARVQRKSCHYHNNNILLPQQHQMAATNDENEAKFELEELYRTVAENDSDWYKEFVLDVLGEETAPFGILSNPATVPIKMNETKDLETLTTETSLKDDESDKNDEEIAIAGKEEIGEVMTQDNKNQTQLVEKKKDNDTVIDQTEISEIMVEDGRDQKPSIEEENDLYVAFDENKFTNENSGIVTDQEAETPALKTSPKNKNIDKDATVPTVDETPKRNQVKSAVEVEVDEIVGSIKQMLETNEVAPKKQMSTQIEKNQIDDEPASSIVEEKEAGTITKDDLDLSVDELVTTLGRQPSVQGKDAGSSLPTKLLETEQLSSVKNTSISTESIVDDTNDNVNNDNTKNNVVQFRNLFTGQFQSVPLQILLDLGYNQSEIPYLQPDALELIIEEQISKPRIGIPPQWKITESQYKALPDDVRIIPQSEVVRIEEEQKYKRNRSDPSNDRNRPQGKDSKAMSESDRKFEKLEKETRGPRKQPRPESKVSNEKKRQMIRTKTDYDGDDEFSERPSRKKGRPSRRGINGNDDERRIYSGRADPPAQERRRRSKKAQGPTVARRQDPPGNRFWPGMDTFRGLLATESEMRLRILGRGWTDVIRDEADWRLNTYKSWLEMLDEGVGTPIMESRSDRDRKMRQKYIVTESPPRRSERQTRRREPETHVKGRKYNRLSDNNEARRKPRSKRAEDNSRNPDVKRRRRRDDDSYRN